MHPPPLSAGGGRVEPSTKFSKSWGGGGFDRTSTFRGGDFFQGEVGGCNCHIKNKLKSEMLSQKKVYKQKSFSLS